VSDPHANPYRQILRRHIPWPVLVLLAGVLGWWVWSHYFGRPEGYAPGTEVVALRKTDRDLRLSEAMAGDPPWLRWLAGAEDVEVVRARGAGAMRRIWRAGSADEGAPFSPAAVEAWEILQNPRRGDRLLARLQRLGWGLPTPGPELLARLEAGGGYWWEAVLLRAYGEAGRVEVAAVGRALARYDEESQRLRERAILARGAGWAVVFAGTWFLPMAMRRLVAAATSRTRGYAGGWSLSVGCGVFLIATLAWVGFGSVVSIGLWEVEVLPDWATLFFDVVLRLLPALIVVAVLFRRPRHAVRVLGLARDPCLPLALGTFAALSWFDGVMSRAFGIWVEADPAGGLDAADAGGIGLVLVVVSACLVAPLTEEILYRGVLFRSLANRFGTMPGAVFSAGAFALVHFYNPYGLANVALFGLACALAYAATGRLATAVLLHALHNAAVTLPDWFIYHAPLS
jgi:membrane protease YdiL (CAAX protease family)